ncbi:FTR1 family iron permease [Alsobacter sp. SYSU BS001988]
MTSQLGNIVFIIWRESVEALLVVGILNAWLQRLPDSAARRRARLFLWSGVGAGLLLAALFAAALIGFGDALPDEAQQAYKTAAVLVAAGLIVQMVLWMRRHGPSLKRDLEAALGDAAARASWWGVFTLALIAVAREGGETAVFLYGAMASGAGADFAGKALAVAAGLAAAVASYGALQIGGRRLSWRAFFRASEIVLLFLAASLVLTGVDALSDLGLLPHGSGKLWDSSRVLSDGGVVGGLVSALTGYRARPDLVEVVAFAGYWILVLWSLSFSRPAAKAA